MPLNKDILGLAIYTVRNNYSNKTAQQLINSHGSIEAARLQAATDEAEAIIDHFVTNAVILPSTLFAPQNAGLVTGAGKII
jgi:phage gp36-like protein